MKPTLILVLLLANGVFADSWHPLHPGKTAPEPAGIRIAGAGDTGITLAATFPGFSLAGRRHPLAGDYLAPEIPGCGVSEPIGAPELPVLRRLVAVPDGAGLRLAVSGTPAFFTLGSPRTQLFFPRQRPRVKPPHSPKFYPFDFDTAAYASDGFAPAAACRLVEAGRVEDRRLILVEVFPVSVNPLTQALRVFPDLTVDIRFDLPKGVAAAAPAAPAPLAAAVTLNGMDIPGAVKAPPRLLVIVPDAWLSALAPLVSHREARGWVVDTLGTATAGATPAAIRAAIRTRWLDPALRPSALLLVGDIAQVPCFAGTQSDNPDTDLYYTCMDGASDWQPEFPVGRISVQTTASLEAVLAKILAAETAPADAWISRVAFMAGEDNHSLTEGTHNTVISTWLSGRGYQSDKLFTVSRSATPAQVKAAFNEGRVMGVYSGHGDVSRWSDGPVFLKSDVQALTNRGRYPMVFSFSCLTGRFGLNECFAETWLRAPEKGAACILASSVTSYWNEDDVLEKKIFETLFRDNQLRYGDAILRAKYKLIETYGMTATIRRYFEQYNLLGDPVTPLRQPGLAIGTAPLLPTASTGSPYSVQFEARGGLEPYAWTLVSPAPAGLQLDAATGILSGTPTVAGQDQSFTVRLRDASAAEAAGEFRLTVADGVLQITNETQPAPFRAGVPISFTLAARGGLPPYAWSLRDGSSYAAVNGAAGYMAAPVAWNRSGDERSWKLALPWPFRFYDTTYTSIWINSNGYVDFGSRASQFANSTAELRKHPRIAPLWDDLKTTNIFLNATSKKLVIRWTGSAFGSGSPVDFEAVLNRNGTIRFLYKATGRVVPTCGVSAGDGVRMTLGGFNRNAAIPPGSCTKMTWRSPLPPGLSLSPGGVLSGTVANPVIRTVPVTVSDRSTPAQTDTADITIRVD